MKSIPIALNWPDSNYPDTDCWIPWIALIPIAANYPESNWPESDCPKCDCISSNCLSSNCPNYPDSDYPKLRQPRLCWSPNRIRSACPCWGDRETVYSLQQSLAAPVVRWDGGPVMCTHLNQFLWSKLTPLQDNQIARDCFVLFIHWLFEMVLY